MRRGVIIFSALMHAQHESPIVFYIFFFDIRILLSYYFLMKLEIENKYIFKILIVLVTEYYFNYIDRIRDIING